MFDPLSLGGRVAGGFIKVEVQRNTPCQHPVGMAIIQQLALGLLQRCEVRNPGQPQVFTPRRVVLEGGDDAAVVGLVEPSQHQAGE